MTTDRNLNVALHSLLGVAEVCETGCTHLVAGNWTALGLANVAGRVHESRGPQLARAMRKALDAYDEATSAPRETDA